MATAPTYTAVAPMRGYAPGEPLWGARRQRQPIVPLIAIAIVTLLVAAPAAFSGSGMSANPIVLIHEVAAQTYTITGLMTRSNETLDRIDKNARPLATMQTNMGAIGLAAKGMSEKTVKLNEQLAIVGTSVGTSRATLGRVDGKLTKTASSMGQLEGAVDGSLASTKSIVGEFGAIGKSIGAMDRNLRSVIALMSLSTPQTKAFANNRTRLSIAGGDGTKYGVPNINPGNRVMSVVLPMIHTMQFGGPIAARKESAQASNPLVGFLLKRQVPDGTNVVANVQKFDGTYGMPAPDYFVNNRVNGF